jgi:uncharacterized protein (TIGR03435 family)
MSTNQKPIRLFLICACLCSSAAHLFAQFGPADVHPSSHTASPYIRGPFIRAGRYEIRTATMVDLVHIAYGVDADKVLGGPAWLENDRFDVAARLPADPTAENLKLALQALLADRFRLVVHNDSKSLEAYVLSAGKKPQIKESDGTGETGCKNTTPAGRGGGPVPFLTFSCHNITMEAFAKAMSGNLLGLVSMLLNGTPVVDQTSLKGSWDFDFKLSPVRLGGAAPDSENVTIFDAIDKQLGLKLQLQKTPLPVVVVDSVNEKPTDNPPGIAASLPASPLEFDVADVKPSDPTAGGKININLQPNGRVTLQGFTMKMLIQDAYSLNQYGNSDTIIGAPKWLDSDRFDIVAKVAASEPIPGATTTGQVDADRVWFALRGLLADRFKLAVHFEDQPQPIYAMTVTKSKLTKADPSNRSSCKAPNIIKVLTTTGPGGASSATTLTCRNTTMAQLAEQLQQMSMNDVNHPVVDATGLEGAWDFTLSWTPAIVGQMSAARRANPGGDGPPAADTSATDPGGGVSMTQALERQLGLKLDLQKRPMPVLVIDHLEQKPTDN